MKIECEKQKLLDGINIALRAVSQKATLPVLGCILLQADDSGFKMFSNDLEMGIETNYIEAEILKNGSVALEAKIFADIVRRLPDGTVSIAVDDKNITIIKCGKAEFKIIGEPASEFPVLPIIDEFETVQLNANKLRNMIRQTIFSVSVVDTKPILKGVLLELQRGMLNMVTVDGFRVSFVRNEVENAPQLSVVVPSKTMNEISKILPSGDDAEVSLSMSEQYILFETDDCKLISRLMVGDFMKYENIFVNECTTMVTINRQEILSSLERASLISLRDNKKNPVKLKIEGDLLIISSNTESGTARDELEMISDGSDLIIAFNPKYLLDALKALDEETITMSFTTALSPCVIKGVGNENAKYLILPLRVNN